MDDTDSDKEEMSKAEKFKQKCIEEWEQEKKEMGYISKVNYTFDKSLLCWQL